MFKRTAIVLLSMLLLAGCRSDYRLQKDLKSAQTVAFSIGASREEIVAQLKSMKAKILSDANNVLLVEVPKQHSMLTELTFDADRLKSVTYIPK